MTAKLSIGSWAYTFGPYQDHPIPFDTVVRTLGAYGYDGIEIGAFKPHVHPDDYPMQADRLKLKNLIQVNGLDISGLAADFWAYPGPGTEEAHQDDLYIKIFKKNIQLCLDLGSPGIRVDTVSGPDGVPGVDTETARKRIIDVWRTCAEIAQDFGIKMVWEFEPGFFLNKPSEVVQLVKDINHPNFSVLFDTCHAYMCAVEGSRQPGAKETLDGGVAEFARMLKGHIGHIHLIDSDGTLHDNETSTHRPFGEGSIDFDEAISAIVHDAEFTGKWWTIDLCFWPEAWDVTRNAKEFLKPYMEKYS